MRGDFSDMSESDSICNFAYFAFKEFESKDSVEWMDLHDCTEVLEESGKEVLMELG